MLRGGHSAGPGHGSSSMRRRRRGAAAAAAAVAGRRGRARCGNQPLHLLALASSVAFGGYFLGFLMSGWSLLSAVGWQPRRFGRLLLTASSWQLVGPRRRCRRRRSNGASRIEKGTDIWRSVRLHAQFLGSGLPLRGPTRKATADGAEPAWGPRTLSALHPCGY